jgi:hypothetical protein
MAITYPTTIDSLTNPSSTDTLDSPSHSDQHSDINDAVEALETKVGADSSAVTSSHDYKIDALEDAQPTGDVVGTTDTQTLTNKTITNPDIAFSDNAPDYNVLCRAVRATSNQTISNATETKVELNYETFDVGNDFDSTTNYRFTVPVTGYYHIDAQIVWITPTENVEYRLMVRENGTTDLAASIGRPATSHIYTQHTSVLAHFSASDYIELWCKQSSGGDDEITQYSPFTFMSIMLVST